MIKRCIGIDIGPVHLRAVQIVSEGQGFRIETVFTTQTRRATDFLPDMLRSLFGKYGFDRRAAVAVSTPHDAVFFRNLTTDAAGLDQLRQRSSAELENSFPIPPDQIVAQVCSSHRSSDDKYFVLAGALSRTSLHERLNLLAGAKIHPVLVEAPVFAVHSTIAANHPEIGTGRAIIVYVDESCLTLAVTADNDVLIVRNIPVAPPSGENLNSMQDALAEIVSREAQITWHRVFGAGIEQNTGIYLLATNGDCDYLKSLIEQSLDCRVTIVDPSADVKTPRDEKADPSVCVAEGLALRLLTPGHTNGINFLAAHNDDTGKPLHFKKELVTYAALAGAIVVFLVAGLFMKLSRLEAGYADIKAQIRRTFQTTLPEEKNIVSPLAQLEQRLESFRKDYQLFASYNPAASGPLQILRSVSANTPSQGNLEVDDLLIAGDTVRITGTSDSFESVYEWQRLLQRVPDFTVVEVQDVQKQPKTGIVQFTMLVSSAIQEQR